MADPVGVDCPADTWTKVATNVTAGMVWLLINAPSQYFFTYRDTGNPAPTTLDDRTLFASTSIDGTTPGMPISAATGIDVYIYPTKAAGRVRVDL
jgi:hypothetical protein